MTERAPSKSSAGLNLFFRFRCIYSICAARPAFSQSVKWSRWEGSTGEASVMPTKSKPMRRAFCLTASVRFIFKLLVFDTGVYKSGVNSITVGGVVGHRFGVPLYEEAEISIGSFEGFDNSVVASGNDFQ